MADSQAPLLVWFRQDLRLADNPALHAAAVTGRPVLPLYILDDGAPGRWAMGGASRWWLHYSLQALADSLARLGAPLVLRKGDPSAILPQMVAESGADIVHWNRCYEPFAIARDEAIKTALKADGLTVRSFNSALLHEPWTVENKAGDPFRVYSPFWRACLAKGEPDTPLPAPEALIPAPGVAGDALSDWALLPHTPDWAAGMRESWVPGEEGARQRLAGFLDESVGRYKAQRDRPDIEATSRLSPHLHFGEIGPRQVWHATSHAMNESGTGPSAQKFLSEVGWREFSHHLLFHNRQLPETPLRAEFGDFPWHDDRPALKAWQRGLTGFPIVDAGMRELWHTGWMHNRVRMIVASFLVKDLLIPWQEGEAWFWDTLVDADLANNSASWQWVAGCGADAAPYFRVFNPVLQGQKFDPNGDYVRKWIPALAELPVDYIHNPWTASEGELRQAGVTLGETYPKPIVDHDVARKRALDAFERIKKAAA
ncbi:cryptochrome/photolyase family protein [Oceanibaculum pacificum]|uniref:Deoxyribodipyrimidine photo-lyase n=1 Tax=Oceanibaculum pacificum TaxID=580166 RepID=A0A154VND5_9PROT|nr:deoxyribodipyrimidine photo-lyase [Oceanibaculum pacificum]KZD02780.1 deoxyribodipyrimidine photolyase [Oceanibaculum pacificum]